MLSNALQPNPYTEESAKSWIDFVSKEENMTRSGKWTLEGGSEGPLVFTNYAVTVHDEAVGALGLDFGKGKTAPSRTL